jgi:hypothetical protein
MKDMNKTMTNFFVFLFKHPHLQYELQTDETKILCIGNFIKFSVAFPPHSICDLR